MSLSLENNLIKYALYGVSAIVASELGYRYIRRWMDRCTEISASKSNREIADVIWINELTTDCTIKSPKRSKHNDQKCNNKFCYPRNIGKITTLLDNAKYTIDLSMYIFTSFELSQAIHRALKRGVDIRIISDKEMVYSTGSQITSLTQSGIPVHYPIATNMLMHHKFCIIDGPVRSRAVSTIRNIPHDKVQGIVLSGSLNWTHQGFNANWENMIISSSPTLVQKFEDEFQRMWTAFKKLDE